MHFPQIVIVDYKVGNVASVANAIDYLGYKACLSNDPEVIGDAERLILPGVGAFAQAIRCINAVNGLRDAILNYALNACRPMLGICLGMQLLADESLEGGLHSGLGLIPGSVLPFSDKIQLKVPHMGWNTVQFIKGINQVTGLRGAEDFYFVHSYYFSVKDDAHSIGKCDYGLIFDAIVARENVIGCQFHPEKSQKAGLAILKSFIEKGRMTT